MISVILNGTKSLNGYNFKPFTEQCGTNKSRIKVINCRGVSCRPTSYNVVATEYRWVLQVIEFAGRLLKTNINV